MTNNPSQQSDISGLIKDKFGNPADGVTVLNRSNKMSDNIALSDKDGKFTMTGNIGDTLLFYSPDIATTESVFDGDNPFNILVALSQSALERVTIQSVVERKKDPTRYVDLTNRLYMNLGQVLQGTVPGLSMQLVNTTNRKVTKITIRERALFSTMTADEFLNSGRAHAQEIINGFITGNLSPYIYTTDASQYIFAETVSQVASSMVPQIRGANTFGSSINGMLVVIDGFQQDGFPADYPMSNVESIEVIKDPKELLKWGDKANGGVIFIRTKGARQSKPTINFNSNFYYTPAPKFDRNKMQLANSADYLDYANTLFDSGFISKTTAENSANLTTAQRLLNLKYQNLITDEQFQSSWDSLGHLDNSDQIKLMQQNSFNSNYNLSVLGGTKKYKYNFIGMYNDTKSNALNNYNKVYGLSMTNDFLLLKDQLHITWFSNATYTKSRSGTSFDPLNSLDPYQMLLDNQGNYVYDYGSTIAPVNNDLLKGYGFKEFGTNLLQDARENSNINKNLLLRTRLNWDWKLGNDVKWKTSILYNRTNNTNENLYGQNSSYTRDQINTYSSYNNGILNLYVPNGSIMQNSKSRQYDLNVRTALNFDHTYGKHYINATIGGGGFIYNSFSPAFNTMYGYNAKSKTGLPILLPAGNINNYIFNYNTILNNSSTVFPYTLLSVGGGDSVISKTLNYNASLSYSYSDLTTLSFAYNTSLNPNYGATPSYSSIQNYITDVIFRPFSHTQISVLKKLKVSTGIITTKMPNLPVQYSSTRYLQSNWNNYAIIIGNLNPTQQVGQTSRNFYQKIGMGLFNNKVDISIARNMQKMENIGRLVDSKTVYDSSNKISYLSANIAGLILDSTLSFTAEYSKSPEGQSQVNGSISYNILKAHLIHSNKISSFSIDAVLQNISPMQGLGVQMGTNVSTGSGFSMANNGVLNSLPPKNTNYEIRAKLGFNEDNTLIDIRYYNRTTAGLTSSVPVYTDPSTGLSSQTTYSLLQNRGIEFFLKFNVVHTRKFNYNITLNGAYNDNIARDIPITNFSVSSSYSTAYRSNYSVNNVWSYKWAGLNDKGLPQIYDENNNAVSNPDSATLSKSMVYSGVNRSPWTGGLIHEFMIGDFFARTSMVFNFGGVMRRHIATPSSSIDNSVFVRDRWRKAGDEKFTDIPGITTAGNNNLTSFLAQYSTNSIMSSDYVRLQELMFGWYIKKALLSHLHIKSGFLTLQVQNLAVWTRNKYHLDPATVAFDGRVGFPISRIYSCSLNITL